MATNGQPRVLLWAVYRSCSTAMLRSISQVEGGVYYYEPYNSAAYEGPDSVFPMGDDADEGTTWQQLPGAEIAYDSSVNTFSWVKETLQGEHKGARFVFVKDFPHAFEMSGIDWDIIPQGYKHTFLIRNPNKSVPSVRKHNDEFKPAGMDEVAIKTWQDSQMETMGGGFQCLSGLYEYIKDNLDPNPFIMDADDLLANPDVVLRAYCRATGIPFSKKMVDWEDDGQPPNAKWIACQSHLKYFQCAYHSNAMKSRGLTKSIQANPNSTIDPIVARVIQREMPFYNKMYQQRFIPPILNSTLSY